MKLVLYFILTIVLFSACSPKSKTGKKEIVVFCAASLTEVVSEISSEFEKKNQADVKINLASSGTLARQIEHGAAPAIFISVDKTWMEYLEQLEFIAEGSVKNLAGNSMVLITPLNSLLDSFIYSAEKDLSEWFAGRLSVGDPQQVPAGKYAVQILQSLNCLEELEPRFLPATDVRSALMVVEIGEAEAGIVYKTDALKSQKVKIVTEFPDSLHQPVNYYIAQIKVQENEFSAELYNYILSDEMRSVWKKYGFKI